MARAAKIPDAQPFTEPPTHELYLKDSYAWALAQADAMRRRDFGAVDWEHVIEEIEDLARRDAHSLRSQYARTIQHLLKLEYRQPADSAPVAGWKHSIQDARTEILGILDNSTSLKATRHNLLAQAWTHGRRKAIDSLVAEGTLNITPDSIFARKEKQLRRQWDRLLPKNIPYTLHQLETPGWYPPPKTIARRPHADRRSDPEWTR